jgi:hypothetical protein
MTSRTRPAMAARSRLEQRVNSGTFESHSILASLRSTILTESRRLLNHGSPADSRAIYRVRVDA